MSKDPKKIEKLEKPQVPPYIDPKEVMKRMHFLPAQLEWKNFHQEHPNPDKWIVLWCNLGQIAPNLILTYRDANGNYDLPHPTKSYPVQAWAYINNPTVDNEALAKQQKEIEEASAANLKAELALQAAQPK